MCVLFVKWHQPFFLVCSFCNCLDVFFLYFIIFCTFLGISCSSFFGAKLAGLFLYNKELMTALSRKFAFCLFFCIKNIFTYFLCPLGSLEYSASTFFSFLFFLLFCNLPSFPISFLRWVKKYHAVMFTWNTPNIDDVLHTSGFQSGDNKHLHTDF